MQFTWRQLTYLSSCGVGLRACTRLWSLLSTLFATWPFRVGRYWFVTLFGIARRGVLSTTMGFACPPEVWTAPAGGFWTLGVVCRAKISLTSAPLRF